MSGIHNELLARHRRVLRRRPARNHEHPTAPVEGEGRRARDAAGRECLDFFGGTPVATLERSLTQ